MRRATCHLFTVLFSGAFGSWDDGIFFSWVNTPPRKNTRHSKAARPVARHHIATPLCRKICTIHPPMLLLIIGFTLLSGKRLITKEVRRPRRSTTYENPSWYAVLVGSDTLHEIQYIAKLLARPCWGFSHASSLLATHEHFRRTPIGNRLGLSTS